MTRAQRAIDAPPGASAAQSSLKHAKGFFVDNASRAYGDDFDVLSFNVNAIDDPIPFHAVASKAAKRLLERFADMRIIQDGLQAGSELRFDPRMTLS
ncbi:MAG: hypothetical protein ABIL58_00090 [Pseudomonadota bacterium]